MCRIDQALPEEKVWERRKPATAGSAARLSLTPAQAGPGCLSRTHAPLPEGQTLPFHRWGRLCSPQACLWGQSWVLAPGRLVTGLRNVKESGWRPLKS